mmetsp:Transcript_6967/g.16625  ORF Transcript_6967/g.16625 Transcript_6967/m.16625 type:complete len:268 (-) Transcript_6967:552-1355(-)
MGNIGASVANETKCLLQLVHINTHLPHSSSNPSISELPLETPHIYESRITGVAFVDQRESSLQLLKPAPHLSFCLFRTILLYQGRVVEHVVDNKSVHNLHQTKGCQRDEHDEIDVPLPIYLRQNQRYVRPSFEGHHFEEGKHGLQQGTEQVLHSILPCFARLLSGQAHAACGVPDDPNWHENVIGNIVAQIAWVLSHNLDSDESKQIDYNEKENEANRQVFRDIEQGTDDNHQTLEEAHKPDNPQNAQEAEYTENAKTSINLVIFLH